MNLKRKIIIWINLVIKMQIKITKVIIFNLENKVIYNRTYNNHIHKLMTMLKIFYGTIYILLNKPLINKKNLIITKELRY